MAREHTLAEPKLKVTPRCTPIPPYQCPHQVSPFYILRNQRNNPDKILKLMVTLTRSKEGHTMTLHTYTPNQCPYQVATSYTLGLRDIARTRFYRSRSLWQGQRSNQRSHHEIAHLQVKVTLARSKNKSRSHHDIAYLLSLSNVPTKYQLPTPYGGHDIARTRFYSSRSLRQGQRSNQGHTMTLHTYTP